MDTLVNYTYKSFRAIFAWPWKMVSVSVHYLFCRPKDQKMDSSFSRQRKPDKEKVLFDWPIVLQYDVKVKYRLISRKFSGMKFFHPNVRLANQNPRVFLSVQ